MMMPADATTIALLAFLGRSLLLTIAIELAVALAVLGARLPRQIANVVLAQVVTNPLVQLATIALGWSPRAGIGLTWLGVIAVELIAWSAEALLYRRSQTFEHPWRASILMNATSFAVGLALAVL